MKLYPEDALERFEFDQIRSELVKYCRSEPALIMATGLVPICDHVQLDLTLSQTVEMQQIVVNQIAFPEIGFPPLSTN